MFLRTLAALVLVGACSSNLFAGAIIIAGTDADDHGSVSAGVNQTGWLFMQNAFENLVGGVTTSNNVVVCLGCSSGDGQNAFASAFDLSSLAGGGGWTRTTVDGATGITNFFNGTGATNIGNVGIIYMPTVSGNVGGGITDAELAVVNANAMALETFLAGGGGLFTQEQANSAIGYGWLTTLLPGIVVQGDNAGPNFDENTLNLTANGAIAFPSLTDTILSNATPWHAYFLSGSGNFGGLDVLVTGPVGNPAAPQAVVLGGVNRTIVTPPPPGIPEPSSVLLLGTGLAAALFLRRRK